MNGFLKRFCGLILLLILFSCQIEVTNRFLVIGKNYAQSSAGGMCTTNIPERYWLFLKDIETEKFYNWDNYAAFFIAEKGDIIELHRKASQMYLNEEYIYPSKVKSWKIIEEKK